MAPGAHLELPLPCEASGRLCGTGQALESNKDVSLNDTDITARSQVLAPTPPLFVKNTFIDDWFDAYPPHMDLKHESCPAALASISLASSLAKACEGEDVCNDVEGLWRQNGHTLEVNFDGITCPGLARERAAAVLGVSTNRVMLISNTGHRVDDDTDMNGLSMDDLQIVVMSSQEAKLKEVERQLDIALHQESHHGMDSIKISSPEEAAMICNWIISRALEDPYRCQSYVDFIAVLQSRTPLFPSRKEGEKALKFTRILLDSCQKEYDALFLIAGCEAAAHKISALEAYREKYQHRRRLALLALFGSLFTQGSLGLKVIDQVFHDLMEQCEDTAALWHVEYICNLLGYIGKTLESSPKGEALASIVVSWLEKAKDGPVRSHAGNSKGGKAVIDNASSSDCRAAPCKRIRSMIEKVFEMKGRGWQDEF